MAVLERVREADEPEVAEPIQLDESDNELTGGPSGNSSAFSNDEKFFYKQIKKNYSKGARLTLDYLLKGYKIIYKDGQIRISFGPPPYPKIEESILIATFINDNYMNMYGNIGLNFSKKKDLVTLGMLIKNSMINGVLRSIQDYITALFHSVVHYFCRINLMDIWN